MTYQWLEKVGLRDRTDALITAPDRAPGADSKRSTLESTAQNSRVQDAGSYDILGMPKPIGSHSIQQRLQVWGGYSKNEMDISKCDEKNRAKILWDFQIQSDTIVMANQPDVAVVNKQE